MYFADVHVVGVMWSRTDLHRGKRGGHPRCAAWCYLVNSRGGVAIGLLHEQSIINANITVVHALRALKIMISLYAALVTLGVLGALSSAGLHVSSINASLIHEPDPFRIVMRKPAGTCRQLHRVIIIEATAAHLGFTQRVPRCWPKVSAVKRQSSLEAAQQLYSEHEALDGFPTLRQG